MAVKQISVETEIDVRQYVCLTTDMVEDYPKDTWAGSTMEIVDPDSGVVVAHALFDGVEWKYVKTRDDFADTLTHELVNADHAGEIVLDMQHKRSKKFYTTLVAEIPQLHYIDLAGAVTTAGDISVTVTSDFLEADEVVSVSVLDTDDLPTIAGKIVTELNENEALDGHYFAEYVVVSDPEEVDPDIHRIYYHALVVGNDSTLNIALADVDAEGITPVTTSTEVYSGDTGTEKTIAVNNLQRDGNLELLINYVANQDIDFGTNVVKDDDFPESFTAGTLISIKMFTRNGGTDIYAKVDGVWTL